MARKSKVPVYGFHNKAVIVDLDANEGAQIGKDFRLPDGSVPSLEQLRKIFGGGGGGSATQHRDLQGLRRGDDHPQYTMWNDRETIKAPWSFQAELEVRIGGVQQWHASQTLVSQNVPLFIRNDTDPQGGILISSSGSHPSFGIDAEIFFIEAMTGPPGNEAHGFRWHMDGSPEPDAYLDLYRHDPVISETPPGGARVLRVTRTTGVVDFFAPVRFDSGLAATPSISFTNDPDTGARNPGTNRFGIVTGGSDRFEVGPNGEIGLGGLFYGNPGQVLQSNGPGSPASWASVAASGSALAYANRSVPAGNTVEDTTSETLFESSHSFEANLLKPGDVIRVRLAGTLSTDASVAPELTLRLYFGGEPVLDTGALSLATGLADAGWSLEAQIVVHDDGATGEVDVQATALIAGAPHNVANASTFTVDTTDEIDIEASAEWDTADEDNSITLRQLAIFRDAAPAEDVDLYLQAVLADSPVAFWRLDEETGNAARDSSSNLIDVTFSGTPIRNQSPLIVNGVASTRFNSSGVIVGSQLPDLVSVNRTYEAWVVLAGTGEQRIVDWQDTAGYYSLRVTNAATGAAAAQVNVPAGEVIANFTIPADSQPHHVVFVRDTNEIRVYVDGELEAQQSATGAAGSGTARAIGRHRTLGQNHWNGWMEEIAIYNYALSEERLAAHYAIGSGGA